MKRGGIHSETYWHEPAHDVYACPACIAGHLEPTRGMIKEAVKYVRAARLDRLRSVDDDPEKVDEYFDIFLEKWHVLAGEAWNHALEELGLTGEDQ